MQRPLVKRRHVAGALLVGLAVLAVRPARRPARSLAPSASGRRVAAVIPTLDEAGTIDAVVRDLRRAGVDSIVVVDGGSRDATPELASAAGAVVVRDPRRGYGRACLTGAEAADADVIVFLDGDGSDDPAYVPELIARVVDGGAALALGARTSREPGALLLHQRLGTRFVTLLLWLVHGVRVRDVPPMRAIRADVLSTLGLREMTYGWPTEMIVKVARAGLPIAQVDVRARRRAAGRSKIAGRLVPSVAAGMRMVGVVLRSA